MQSPPPPAHQQSETPSAATDAPAAPPPPVVLILVGLIGSGKSTFATALEAHAPHFVRCNQDELGSRPRVEARARACLRAGRSVCIDRTNFDARQRATWIALARAFPGTEAWVLVFDTPYAECARRLRGRTDHPTIGSPADALQILARFHAQYEPPAPREGFARMRALGVDAQRCVYAREDVGAVLESLRGAPLLSGAQGQAPVDAFFPPAGRRGAGRGAGERGYGAPRGGYRGAFRGASSSARGGAYTPYDSGVASASTESGRGRATGNGAGQSYRRRGRGSDSPSWRRDEGRPER